MNIKPQLEDLRLFCVVARNRSFAETARELGIASNTVRVYRHQAMRMLGTSRIVVAVLSAREKGLL